MSGFFRVYVDCVDGVGSALTADYLWHLCPVSLPQTLTIFFALFIVSLRETEDLLWRTKEKQEYIIFSNPRCLVEENRAPSLRKKRRSSFIDAI